MSVDVWTVNVHGGARRDEAGGPGLERSVPRRLVHKTSEDEVLLTDAVRVGHGHFHLAVRGPAGHAPFRPGPAGPAVDPTLFVEMLRQTAIYLSHRFYGVPLEHPFIFCDLDFDLASGGLGPAEPEEAVFLEVECRETGRRGPRGTAMSLDARLLADGGVRAAGSVSWQAVHATRYAAVRRRGLGGAPVPRAGEVPSAPLPAGAVVEAPERVGREREPDVVVARLGGGEDEPGGVWALRVDQRHPSYFDHPSDHVPGMLLLEAFRQAARAAGAPQGRVLSGGSVTFAAFCELNVPVRIEVRPSADAAGGPGLVLQAVQGDTVVATGQARWAEWPTARMAPGLSAALGADGPGKTFLADRAEAAA
ncbi:ScbA/BarX family gamma-butyrolactone biosynthesis protein [Streptomyces sp. NPDC052109]|uniref:ScbA/BarX family gamma-butyrolactone biosynthesis protein n=1 Tax=Streptomyces sp. NPDC052109 TaxID=3155527 RepID=UPI003418A224